jgi:hypothetical protein
MKPSGSVKAVSVVVVPVAASCTGTGLAAALVVLGQQVLVPLRTVSLPKIVRRLTELSSSTVKLSSLATGPGGGGTVMKTVAVSVPPAESWMVYAQLAVPTKPAVGCRNNSPPAWPNRPFTGLPAVVKEKPSPSASASLPSTPGAATRSAPGPRAC